jgi:hypothetical protein
VFDGTSVKDATIAANTSVQGIAINAGYSGTITQSAGVTLTVGAAGFSQAAGTFAGGTAAITVNDGFMLSGGSFTSSTGTLTVTGAFTKSGGSFAHNGGTVAFSTSNSTINVGGSETFNNVSFLSATKTIAAGNTLVVTGTLNLAGGTVNTGTLAAQGTIDAQLGFTGGGTATLLIDGAADQTFTGFHTSTTGALPNVTIAKSAGTLTLAGTLRTGRNWTYTSGLLDPGTSTVVFTGSSGGVITGSHTLNNVEIRGGTVTIAAGTTLTAAGNLNLFSGSLSTGTLAAQGNIDAQIGFTGGGTGTLLINGAGAQTFTGFHTTAAGSLPNVDINKPGGTLTIAGTLRTARNWTYTAGLVDPSTSTLVFNGTLTISGSHTLNNVEIRGGTITIAAGTTLTVAGTTTLFSGTLNTGTLAAQGDIFARIGFSAGGGSATLLINGTGIQVFDGDHTSASGGLPNVTIDKPAGTLTLIDTLRTARNWTYTAGLVDPGTSTLVFNGTLTISGSHTLNNVEIRGGTITIAAGTTLTVAGNLNLFSGTVNTGTLAAQGTIDAQLGFTGGGTATLLIDGAADQTFTGFHTSTTGALPNVTIAKSAGTLTLAGTLRTGRNWTYTSGLLDPGTSTVVFTGSSGGVITGSHTLNNVEIRGGTVTIAAGTTLTAAGNLNLFSGSLSTGTLAAQGNIDAQIGFTGGGTGTLLINGAGAQTFTGFHTTAAGSLPNVDINKPGGTLTIAGTLRTARNWTYTAGLVDPSTSTLVFNGTLTISGSHTLNNVELRSGNVTVTPGDTLTVRGMLTLTDGNLEGGTVAALGDISLAAAFDGETGTLRIAGTGNQTWTGAANTTSSDMANVVIDKPSGTLFLVGTIRMTTSSWTWLQGALDPGTSTIYFDANVTISGTHTLNNVYLSGGTHTVGGGMPTAGGTMTLDNGTIDGGTFGAAGAIDQLSTFDGGSGTLEITGAANQTFTGAATLTAGDLPNIVINKSGGTLFLVGTLRISGASWTYVGGVVDAGSSVLVVAGTSTLAAAGMAFNDLTVNGGTTTLTQGLNVSGDLLVAAGTLNAAGMTIVVSGDVTIDGAFTPGAGVLEMNGAAAQTLGGAAANIGLYDFTVNNAVGVTITTAVSVAGTLTLNGPLDISGQTLGIANPIAGTPTLLTGDPLSSLVISGTSAGIIIPSSLPVLANLTLDNPQGAALGGPLTIGNLLTLTDGVLNAGGWVVTIDPAGSVARTAGHVSGALRKTIPIGAGVTLTFEIGDATTYAPVSLVFGTVSVSGTITASTTPGEHPNIGSSVIDPSQDVNRWWSLVNGGTVFSTLDATFTFAPSDVDPGASTAAFVVAKWDGAWVLPVSGAALPTSITAFGMTSLSEFAVGEVESADLPDTAGGVPVSAAGSLLTSLLAALMVLRVPAVPSLWARLWPAPIGAARGPQWEIFWQEFFR